MSVLTLNLDAKQRKLNLSNLIHSNPASNFLIMAMNRYLCLAVALCVAVASVSHAKPASDETSPAIIDEKIQTLLGSEGPEPHRECVSAYKSLTKFLEKGCNLFHFELMLQFLNETHELDGRDPSEAVPHKIGVNQINAKGDEQEQRLAKEAREARLAMPGFRNIFNELVYKLETHPSDMQKLGGFCNKLAHSNVWSTWKPPFGRGPPGGCVSFAKVKLAIMGCTELKTVTCGTLYEWLKKDVMAEKQNVNDVRETIDRKKSENLVVKEEEVKR